MNEEERALFCSGLVSRAYPAAEPVGADDSRFVRRWIVRCKREVPAQPELNSIGARIARDVEATFRSSYVGHASEEQLIGSRPGVMVIRIDQNHLVAEVELPAPSLAIGDVAAIGTWMTLRALDEIFAIEDLQGLPKQFWFQLA